MPLPPLVRTCCRSKLAERSETHPYIVKLDVKLRMMRTLMNGIFDIADSNLIILDAKSRLNNFSMNHDFADKLDSLAKEVLGLSKCLSDKAAQVREKVDKALDDKRRFQDVHFVRDVTNQMEKCQIAQLQKKSDYREYKYSEDYRIPCEHLDTSDEEDAAPTAKKKKPNPPELGEPDKHFMYPKDNENDVEKHNFVCKQCSKVFRDINDLRNHDTQHWMEFYRCLLCARIFRSMRAFETHQKSHSASYTCGVCRKTFKLKSTLTNHLPVHSSDTSKCSHPGCAKRFKHRANHLEHVNYAHRKMKDVPCTHCSKMFQTPSSMRAHRVNTHGYVENITTGHPHGGKHPNKPSTLKKKKKAKTSWTFYSLRLRWIHIGWLVGSADDWLLSSDFPFTSKTASTILFFTMCLMLFVSLTPIYLL